MRPVESLSLSARERRLRRLWLRSRWPADQVLTMFRRTVYATSAAGAALLLGTLVWNLLDRHPLHLGDRGVRVIDHLRDLARM